MEPRITKWKTHLERTDAIFLSSFRKFQHLSTFNLNFIFLSIKYTHNSCVIKKSLLAFPDFLIFQMQIFLSYLIFKSSRYNEFKDKIDLPFAVSSFLELFVFGVPSSFCRFCCDRESCCEVKLNLTFQNN